MSLQFSHSLTTTASFQDVWLALTDPVRVGQYHLVPLRVLESKKGGQIIFGPDGENIIIGEITEFAPGKCLEHTFRFMPNHTGTANDPQTLVRYDIEADPDGTKLTLTHSGFSEENKTYVDISGGWPYIFERLSKFLAND